MLFELEVSELQKLATEYIESRGIENIAPVLDGSAILWDGWIWYRSWDHITGGYGMNHMPEAGFWKFGEVDGKLAVLDTISQETIEDLLCEAGL